MPVSEHFTRSYCTSLERRYAEKLKIDKEDLPDPYGTVVPGLMMFKWPSIQFGDFN